MREETHESLRRLFEEVIDLPPGERAARLDHDCPPALRPRLEVMLVAAESESGFLADPPPGAAPTFEPTEHERPGVKIGPFELLEQIGEGGFGVVFLAEQHEPVQRRVALKVIKLGMDTQAVIARFEVERQALALMDHQNIARVLEAGATEAGRPYFVMELVEGEPVTRYCDAHSLGIHERLELFTQVCHAVQHAHAKGVIHRDLKPSNILVSTQDERPLAKVIDFGIAKATQHRLTERTLFTEHRALIGTPEYMSPEQADGSLDIDTRSDVYALGVLLYELLTGVTPFDARELRAAPYAEIQRIIREEEPQKPSTRVTTLAMLEQVAALRRAEPRKLGMQLRGDLDWIVMRCLEKDRARRYETAASLAEDVRRHLTHEPVLAGPPSRAYRVRKFARRHRTMVSAAALVAGALLFGTAGTTFGLVRAEHRRAEAEAAREETQKVADFQASMISGIDARAMGHGIVQLLREQVRASFERQYVGESPNRRPRTTEEVEAKLVAFDELTDTAHAVDVARGVMDEFVLARAAAALDEKFANQPMVRADLHSAIGATYFGLTLYSKAEPHQIKALELYRRLRGEDHPHTLVCKLNVGAVFESQGKYSEAEPYYRAVVDVRRRDLGNENEDTLGAIASLGTLLFAMGNFEEAEQLYREALDGRRRLLSADHRDTLIMIDNMGQMLQARNKMTEAEQYMLEALEGFKQTLGPDDQHTLTAMNNLGALLTALSRYDEALPYYRDALKGRERLLGNDDPMTLMSKSSLSDLLQYLHRWADAKELNTEALKQFRRVLGDGHPDTLVALNNMAYLLMETGRLHEAEELFEEGTRTARDRLDDHSQTATLEHHWADVLLQLHRLAEAIDVAQTAVERYQAHPDWWARESAHAHGVLAYALMKAGRKAESLEVKWQWTQTMRRQPGTTQVDVADELSAFGAEELATGDPAFLDRAEQFLRENWEIRKAVIPDDSPDVWTRYNAMGLLGEVLMRRAAESDAPVAIAMLTEAGGLLVESANWLTSNSDRIPPDIRAERIRVSQERVIRLYERWDAVEPGTGKAEKADYWRAEASKLEGR